MQKITPFLWFDSEAEAAASLYTSIFPDSKIKHIERYPEAAEAVSGKKTGSVMTVIFEINGQEFIALNGGPQFTFNESVSLLVNCEDQAEVDRYWDALIADGGQESQCGWLKDRFGLSWQIIPKQLGELMSKNPAKAERVTAAMLRMKKIIIKDLQDAYDQA